MNKIKKEQIKTKGWILIPEDKGEELIAVHSMDWALSMLELDGELRAKLKYGNDFKNADSALEWVRETLHNILEDHNISLDMII